MTISRRRLLGLAASSAVAAVAGCSRAAQNGRRSSTPGAAARGAAVPATGTTASATTAPVRGTPSRRTPRPTAARTTQATASAGRDGSAGPAGPAMQVMHGVRTRPEVALTFHGQGDPGIAHELLAIFADHGAAVTVLAVGTWLEQFPAMAPAIVDAGHELGNHTYHHWDIDSLGARAARAEIVRCRDLLTTLVGSPGAHFRQSQSRTASPLVRRLAGAAGYPVCLSYDVDSLDYTDPGAEVVRRNVRRARNGSIVSMHFGHPGTVAAMPGILRDLSDRGLRAVTAATLLEPS